MKNKEMIEEMAKTVYENVYLEGHFTKGTSKAIARFIMEQGYRKLPKDSVVLSKEELNEIIKQTKETEKNYYKKVVIPQARKETAEKILNDIYTVLWDEETPIANSFVNLDVKIRETAKQFGVEIKE